MLSSGYSLVSDKPYSHPTKPSEIDDIGKRCTASSYMCLAGGQSGSDNLMLVGCGNCFTLLKRTPLNRPNFNSGAYWYFTDGVSMGFSDTSSINQAAGDTAYSSNEYKLSWHTDRRTGGWRIGKISWLIHSTDYKKYILIKI